MDEMREAGMNGKKKETVQDFLTVLSGGLCQLQERVSQISKLLGVGPSLEPVGKTQTVRSGTVGHLLDDLEGKARVVKDLYQELDGILHELERI